MRRRAFQAIAPARQVGVRWQRLGVVFYRVRDNVGWSEAKSCGAVGNGGDLTLDMVGHTVCV
jgi:hypothetical protein